MNGFRNDIAYSTNEDKGSFNDDNNDDNTGELTFLCFLIHVFQNWMRALVTPVRTMVRVQAI